MDAPTGHAPRAPWADIAVPGSTDASTARRPCAGSPRATTSSTGCSSPTSRSPSPPGTGRVATASGRSTAGGSRARSRRPGPAGRRDRAAVGVRSPRPVEYRPIVCCSWAGTPTGTGRRGPRPPAASSVATTRTPSRPWCRDGTTEGSSAGATVRPPEPPAVGRGSGPRGGPRAPGAVRSSAARRLEVLHQLQRLVGVLVRELPHEIHPALGDGRVDLPHVGLVQFAQRVGPTHRAPPTPTARQRAGHQGRPTTVLAWTA